MSQKKIDRLFWFIIAVLPIFCWFVANWRNGAAESFHMYIGSEWAFSFVMNALDGAFNLAFGEAPLINGYISYLVSIEIVHCLFDAIVFIPRFAHRCIDKFTKEDEKKC